MANRPTVFIGSSAKSLPWAREVKAELDHDADVTIWAQDVFQPGRYVLPSLVAELDRFDFGIFIAAPDDVVVKNGNAGTVTRDNVIFEMGLFCGRLGVDRTFLFVPRGVPNLTLPSDLLGLIPFEYDGTGVPSQTAVASACHAARKRIQQWKRPEDPRAAKRSYERLFDFTRNLASSAERYYSSLSRGEVLYPYWKSWKGEITVEADGTCGYKATVELVAPDNQSISTTRVQVGAESSLADFAGLDLRVRCLSGGRSVEWLPIRDEPTDKRYALFFSPPLAPKESVTYSMSWKWPDLWRPLIDKGEDEWRLTTRTEKPSKEIEFVFYVFDAYGPVSISNVGHGGGTEIPTNTLPVRHGYRALGWRMMDVVPNTEVILRLCRP
ncbi:MAG: nucleotide-binding protein [Tepidisphaeraceae bacterium]